MAFEFKTRMDDQIFFPTVHIHDGEVHETEHFEHQLYCQSAAFDEIASTKYTLRPDAQTRLVRAHYRIRAGFPQLLRCYLSDGS